MAAEDLQFIPFHPKEASQQDMEAMLALFEMELRELNPHDPLPPRSHIRQSIEARDEHPLFTRPMYLVRAADGALIGRVEFMFPREGTSNYEQRKHKAVLRIHVVPEMRRRGFGTQMLGFAAGIGQEHGITYFGGYSSLESGQAFARRAGAVVELEESDYRVQSKDLDWTIIQDWYTSGTQRNPDTRIIAFDGLYADDDAELLRFCDLLSAVLKDVPRGENTVDAVDITPEEIRLDHEQSVRQGMTTTYMITVEADGRFSGITRMTYQAHAPHHLRQGITGVVSAERGRGLGKWLKAAMLIHVRERYPDATLISTGTSTMNAPMYSINDRLGFRLNFRREYYDLLLEDAKAFTGKR